MKERGSLDWRGWEGYMYTYVLCRDMHCDTASVTGVPDNQKKYISLSSLSLKDFSSPQALGI